MTNLETETRAIKGHAPLLVLLQVSDDAIALGVSEKKVKKLVREGKLACVQVTTRDPSFCGCSTRELASSQGL